MRFPAARSWPRRESILLAGVRYFKGDVAAIEGTAKPRSARSAHPAVLIRWSAISASVISRCGSDQRRGSPPHGSRSEPSTRSPPCTRLTGAGHHHSLTSSIAVDGATPNRLAAPRAAHALVLHGPNDAKTKIRQRSGWPAGLASITGPLTGRVVCPRQRPFDSTSAENALALPGCDAASIGYPSALKKDARAARTAMS